MKRVKKRIPDLSELLTENENISKVITNEANGNKGDIIEVINDSRNDLKRDIIDKSQKANAKLVEIIYKEENIQATMMTNKDRLQDFQEQIAEQKEVEIENTNKLNELNQLISCEHKISRSRNEMNRKLQMATLISIKDEIKEKRAENKILAKFKKMTPKIDNLFEQTEIIANQEINKGNQLMIAINENFNRIAETLNMMQIQTINECQKQLLIPVQNCFAAFRTLSDQLQQNFQATFKNQNNMLFMLCYNIAKSNKI
jgi:hypothetical protein